MIAEPTVQRVISLRDLATRLGAVLEAIITQQDNGIDDARELLEELHKILPRESLAELNPTEIHTVHGCLIEVKERRDLGIFLKEDDNNNRHGLVLMSATKTVESIHLDSIYPRWDLPTLFPDNGFPREINRSGLQSINLASDLGTEPIEAKATDPETPNAPGNQEELPDNEEFVPVTEEEFYELPNKSLVRAIDKETGQEIVGTRTRKGRWALSNVAKPVNDVEAWEILLDASEDDEVYLLVVSE